MAPRFRSIRLQDAYCSTTVERSAFVETGSFRRPNNAFRRDRCAGHADRHRARDLEQAAQGRAQEARPRRRGGGAMISLITGGVRGQGASHAERLARDGYTVITGDVLDDAGEETAARLRGEGLAVTYRHLNVTS